MNKDTEIVESIINNIEQVFMGKRDVVTLMLITLLARGHVLLEDVPGVGKTSLANALSKSINASFMRIQFTPDTTASDVTGFSMYDSNEKKFKYEKGAILNNIVLADELNRTSPKTQAALLEAMEDGRVTVDGNTYEIPKPFILIATQNPKEQFGTYPLPESQIDRFMMKLSIGYPEKEVAIKIIQGINSETFLESICSGEDILMLQNKVDKVYINEEVSRYIIEIAEETRKNTYLQTGISTRGTILITKSAKARAFILGRDYVIPDDVKYLLDCVVGHRLILNRKGVSSHMSISKILSDIKKNVPVPIGSNN